MKNPFPLDIANSNWIADNDDSAPSGKSGKIIPLEAKFKNLKAVPKGFEQWVKNILDTSSTQHLVIYLLENNRLDEAIAIYNRTKK